VLVLRLEVLAGVAERRDGQDGAVPDAGEYGAVLNLSEGAGEAMLESCSRDVSEIKIDGLSIVVSKDADLCSRSWVSKDADLCSRSWVSKPAQICSMVGSADASGPK
jgi:hypothetical protein